MKFQTKSKNHEIQILGFAQRMQGLTKPNLLQTLLLWGRKKEKKRQGKDEEEHYFYIRAIKFLYKQDI